MVDRKDRGMFYLRHQFVALAVLAVVTSASAAELRLGGAADGTSRWYEYFSNAYAQLNLDPQGFYSVTDDSPLGAGDDDVFPDDSDFDLGTLSYDDGGLTGSGVETAAITGYVVDFQQNIADDDNILNVGYVTAISNLTGTVEFTDGVPTSIDLSSTITFTYDPDGTGGVGPLSYAGIFGISGDSFTLSVDDTNSSPFGDLRYRWESTGSVSIIPEPASIALLAIGLMGLLSWRKTCP